jgi:hypothetical protein
VIPQHAGGNAMEDLINTQLVVAIILALALAGFSTSPDVIPSLADYLAAVPMVQPE